MIQVHIESIGKPILLRGDEVLIMTLLLKYLLLLLQNHRVFIAFDFSDPSFTFVGTEERHLWDHENPYYGRARGREKSGSSR